MYEILPYTKAQARKINVVIKPSIKKGKKIDVFDKKGNYIVSVGATGYLDFPNYKKYFGNKIANERRKLYKLRHKKNRLVKHTAGWYADKLLW
jgi:hypothetical protein